MINPNWLICLLLVYLTGSIPSCLWLGRLFFHVDIRKKGSGNAGATNAYRILGWRIGLLGFLLDFLKGVAAMWICSAMHVSPAVVIAGALITVVGHRYPVFAGFRGGKGVSTSAGIILWLDWYVLTGGLLVFIAVVAAKRIVSMGSLIAVVSAVGVALCRFVWFSGSVESLTTTALLGAFLIISHRENLTRMKQGIEPTVGA